jgi:tetratricopeptide (TPR) repeat protein
VGDTERSLDRAAKLTELRSQSAADGDPSDARYCDLELYLKISRAKCYLSLGDGGAAISAFGEVIGDLPPEYHRDRGQYLARLAQASILAGLPDLASSHALEALEIALATGSSRTISDIRGVAHTMAAQWPARPQTQDLREILGTINNDH